MTAVALPSARRKRIASAWQDLASGFSEWWIWGRLGVQDIRVRYRGSVLGPFWITLSLALTVGTLGILFSRLNHMEIGQFLPFLCLGYLGWGFISTVINESCTVFIAGAATIKQTNIPLCSFVLQVLWRNILVFLHNILVYVGLAAYLGLWPGPLLLVSLAGLALVFVNLMWIGLLLGLLSARFRDIPMIVSSVLQLIFFITPILWRPEQIGAGSVYLLFNPFYLFLTVFRAPLLGEMPPLVVWGELIGITLAGCTLTFFMFARFRGRIAYWI